MNNINWNKSGNNFSLIPSSDGILEKLPPAIYRVEYHQELGFYLSHKSKFFPEPSKIYDFNNPDMDAKLPAIFLDSFTSNSCNLGVALLGEKGTGKSLLMKRTANKALEEGMPVISVENSYPSEDLSKFLSSIKESCVVLFDEFDKKYTKNSNNRVESKQEGLLSYFDGTSTNKKLIIITANDESKISEFFFNRPSRIRYTIRYGSLKSEFVEKYLEDNLKHKEVVQALLDELDLVNSINFDLLNSIIKEVNQLYPKLSIKSIISILNIQRDTSLKMHYHGCFIIKGKTYTIDFITVDWRELSEYGEYWLELDRNSLISLRKDYPDTHSTLSFTFNNITRIKDRNHIKVTSKIRLEANGDPIPVEMELERIKIQENTF